MLLPRRLAVAVHLDTGRDPAWVRALDAAVDGAVLSFALWTLLYETGIAWRLSAWTVARAWLPAAALIVAGCVLREVLRRRRSAPEPTPEEPLPARAHWWSLTRQVLLGAGMLLAALTASLAYRAPVPDFRLLWVTGLAAAVLLAAFAVTTKRTDGTTRRPGTPSHLLALAMVLALSAFTLFIRNPSSDDIYYVNRSVWVAEQGTFATRDTIFSANHLPSTYGFPVASVEALFGSLAHLTGMGAAAFTYLVAAPVVSALAAWSLWRLAAAWAPRRAVVVFLVTLLVYLWCATGTVGDFSFARMWQGKVIGVCLVVPLAWLYLTRLARATGAGNRAWTLLLLLGLGIAFVGLSTTGILLAPVMAGATVLAALVLRRGLLRLLAGAALFALGPVVAGLSVLLFTSQVQQVWQKNKTASVAFEKVVGTDPWLVALLVGGLLVGPVLVRSREGRALAAAASFVVFVVLTPGLFHLMNALIRVGPIDYRLLLMTPVPLLVGLLAAVPLPGSLPALVRWPVAAALAAGLVLVTTSYGTPVWGRQVSASLTPAPTLKTHLYALPYTKAVLALHPGPGPVLMPRRGMALVPLLTSRVHAVYPRKFYLHALAPKAGHVKDRTVLLQVTKRSPQGLPSVHRIRRALTDLRLSLACVNSTHTAGLARLEKAGFGSPVRVGKLTCVRPSGKGG